MKRLSGLALVIAIAALWTPHAPAAAPAQTEADRQMAAAIAKVPGPDHPLQVHLPRPQTFRLKNGLLLLVMEDHRLPTVAMTMRTRAGSFFEPADKQGLAAMTAAMLDEGTEGRTGAQVAQTVDAMGAELSASSEQGGPMATLFLSGFSEDADRLVDLLADVTRHPTFPKEGFDKVQRQTLADLVQDTKDPQSLADAAILRALYGATPPARVMPPLAQVEALTPADLSGFHARYYCPERTVLGVAGDVRPEAMRDLVERAFGDWEKGTLPLQADLPSYKPARPTRAFLVERPGSVQTVLHLGNLALTRTSGDYPAMVVMNHILGGTYTSRLWMNIRETKGYAYDVSSEFSAPRYTGYWTAGAEVRNAVTADAVAQFLREFARLRDADVSPEELAGAKQSILGRFARQMESPSSLLDNALDVVEYGLPPDYWDRFVQRIQAVRASDVRRVARKYLVNPQIVAVGERVTIEAALRTHGPVATADPVAASR